MTSLLHELVGAGTTLGLERLNAGVAIALRDRGFRIVDAQEPVEMARAIKSSEEIIGHFHDHGITVREVKSSFWENFRGLQD